MSSVRHSAQLVLLAAAIATIAIACDGAPTGAARRSPLAGLDRSTSNDSATHADTGGAPQDPGPGTIRGTVRGQADPGAGPDTMANAPRLADVHVVAYKRLPSDSGVVLVGDQVASALTNAAGDFQLPTLPGGEYVVTFTPPSTSVYRGIYVSGPIGTWTYSYPWWIVLPRK